MEKISELLARKYPRFNTAVSTCLVSDALYRTCRENVDYPVAMEHDKFKGIITDRGIASKIFFKQATE